MSFGKGTAKNSEVLRKHKNLATIDQTMTGNYSIAGIDLAFQTEVAGAMLDQLVEFLKRIFVEQKLDPLTRGYLAGGVLLLDARRAATLLGLLLTLAQLIEFGLLLLFLGRHQLILRRDRLTTEDTEEGQERISHENAQKAQT